MSALRNALLKNYYVGGVTSSDETGTYMIMEGPSNRMSLRIPTFIKDNSVSGTCWATTGGDREIFKEAEDIQLCQVEYPQQKSASFKIEKVGDAAYEVRPFFSTTPVNLVTTAQGRGRSLFAAV